MRFIIPETVMVRTMGMCDGTLHIKRIYLEQKIDNNVIENVTCVFIATHPMERRLWYQNASIFSSHQYYLENDRKIMALQEDWNFDSRQI